MQFVPVSFAAVPEVVQFAAKSGLRNRFTTARRSGDSSEGLFSMPLSYLVKRA